ncbi:MAG: ribonuclease HII [Clostridium sp.]|jgi:ribonuclease HII|nr:ribonuclease HII [Clostridium sp.]
MPQQNEWQLHQALAKKRGFLRVCGIDEAGRGPLVGPVCAAAVILPDGCEIEGLNDSKKLSEKKREALYDVICGSAMAYSVAFASAEEIDEINILQATFMAMRRAVAGLSFPPDYALVDGNQDPGLGIPTELIIGGDGKSAAIAAASVLAKVSRDRLLRELDLRYPGYGFARHKGYGTAEHYAALDSLGVCPEHRLSFLKKYFAKKASGAEK